MCVWRGGGGGVIRAHISDSPASTAVRCANDERLGIPSSDSHSLFHKFILSLFALNCVERGGKGEGLFIILYLIENN